MLCWCGSSVCADIDTANKIDFTDLKSSESTNIQYQDYFVPFLIVRGAYLGNGELS
jgi:hypothetical protein